MDDLIKALQILRKYENPTYPTHCEHDELYVDVDASLVSKEDLKTLEELGFDPSTEAKGFYSYKFGSC